MLISHKYRFYKISVLKAEKILFSTVLRFEKINKLKGERNIIMFYTEGCEICKAEKAALRQMASQDSNLQVLLINVDEIMREMPSVSESLFDSFDLSSLPYIFETDRKGVVARRYLSYR